MTSEDLKKMAGHILYEIDSFRQAFKHWHELENLRNETGSIELNQTVECALLHYRIVRSFFIEEPKGDDDVVAVHYVDGWLAKKDGSVLWDKDVKEDVDKRLAHLTTRRLTDVKWRVTEMETAIEGLVGRFKSDLKGEKVDWFAKLVAKEPQASILGTVSNGTQTVTMYLGTSVVTLHKTEFKNK